MNQSHDSRNTEIHYPNETLTKTLEHETSDRGVRRFRKPPGRPTTEAEAEGSLKAKLALRKRAKHTKADDKASCS